MYFSSTGFTVSFTSDSKNEYTGFGLSWNSESNCPDTCSGHGYCLMNNQCSCFGGYYGDSCSQYPIKTVDMLINSTIMSDSIALYQWKYFSFDVNTHSIRELEISTSDTVYIYS